MARVRPVCIPQAGGAAPLSFVVGRNGYEDHRHITKAAYWHRLLDSGDCVWRVVCAVAHGKVAAESRGCLPVSWDCIRSFDYRRGFHFFGEDAVAVGHVVARDTLRVVLHRLGLRVMADDTYVKTGLPNPAGAVDAPAAALLHIVHQRRATDPQRST